MIRPTPTNSRTGEAAGAVDFAPWDDRAVGFVIVRWCGLRSHNSVAQFASLERASDAVRLLVKTGVTHSSLSTVALVTDQRIEALVGIHSNDEGLVRRAFHLMSILGGRGCYFASREAG